MAYAPVTIKSVKRVTVPNDDMPEAAPKPLIDTKKNVINDQDPHSKVPSFDEPIGPGPAWFELAKKEVGVKRHTSSQYSAQIHKYLATVGLGADENISWCSAFAAWCVKESGGSISGVSGMAKSWLKVGEKLEEPKLGCIVVFNRGSNAAQGHVAFYSGAQGGRIGVLGGNQSDSVKFAYYSAANVVGYRWPG